MPVTDVLPVLRAVTNAVVPRFKFNVVAVVLIPFELEVPMLPVKVVKVRALVVSVVDEACVILPALVDKLTDCIEAFPRLPVMAILLVLPELL